MRQGLGGEGRIPLGGANAFPLMASQSHFHLIRNLLRKDAVSDLDLPSRERTCGVLNPWSKWAIESIKHIK